MNANKENFLKELYFNEKSPASFTSPRKLWLAAKSLGRHDISQRAIEKWLSKYKNYTNFKNVNRRFKRLKVIVPHQLYQLDADSLHYKNLVKYNKKIPYAAVFIDIMSKYAWVRPMKSLTGSEMIKTFKSVLRDIKAKVDSSPQLKQLNRRLLNLRSDRGSEFTSKQFNNYLSSKDINHFYTNNELKSNYAERLIRSIRQKMNKLLEAKSSYAWTKYLKDVVHSYNNTVHRSHGMTPQQALSHDPVKLWEILYPESKSKILKKLKKIIKQPNSKYKFKVNDRVKISTMKRLFDRVMDQRFTSEVFTIVSRKMTQDIPQYKLKSSENEYIKGHFYSDELAKVDEEPENTFYKIEKILGERRVKGKREYLIRWEGYGPNFDSYVPEEDVKDIASDSSS